MTDRFLVWGGGGHGRVVIDLLRRCGDTVVGIVDRDPPRLTSMPPGIPVLGEDELLASDRGRLPLGATALAAGIGSNAARWRTFASFPGGPWPARIHPNATVADDVILGAGSLVFAGAIVNVGARIGAAVIINTGAVVEHDCVIDDGSHVSPGAVLCGSARVGPRAWVGAGATVMPGVPIGGDAVVGAGSTVVSAVPESTTVAGVPARVIAAVPAS